MTNRLRVRLATAFVCAAWFLVPLEVVAGHYQLRPFPPKNPLGGTATQNGNSWAYGSSNGLYGASVSAQGGSVSATGAIQTVYDWVRDVMPGTQTPDPLDEPPSEVVVKETCIATAHSRTFNMQGGLAQGSCSNG